MKSRQKSQMQTLCMEYQFQILLLPLNLNFRRWHSDFELILATMLNIKERPHSLLLYTAIVLFVASAFALITKSGFSGYTLFSVPAARMGWIIPLFLAFLWVNYLVAARFLYSRTISWIHIIVTVTSSLLIVILFLAGINSDHRGSADRQAFIGNAMQILFIVFVGSQLIFLFNVLSGIFKRR